MQIIAEDKFLFYILNSNFYFIVRQILRRERSLQIKYALRPDINLLKLCLILFNGPTFWPSGKITVKNPVRFLKKPPPPKKKQNKKKQEKKQENPKNPKKSHYRTTLYTLFFS